MASALANQKMNRKSPPVELEENHSVVELDRPLMGGFLISLIIHSLMLFILALIVIHNPIALLDISTKATFSSNEDQNLEPVVDVTLDVPVIDQKMPDLGITDAPQASFEPLDPLQNLASGPGQTSTMELLTIPDIDLTTHLGGRKKASRQMLLEIFGGNAQSEKAVERGLVWLASHQREDGSWSFDHRPKDKPEQAREWGSLSNCPTGATGMALMAFLGAGHVHTESGPYQQVVFRGLEYLKSAGVEVKEGTDFRGREGARQDVIPQGNHAMYAHSLAAIALSEAYGMTRDRLLREPAQGAMEFLIRIRNRDDGGWRYRPEEPGDLSVTGWVVMALESGHTAGLRFSPVGLESATQFLDACQSAGGSRYGYLAGQGGRLSTTAIGLLCRMYLGWERSHPALNEGIDYLSSEGPSKENIYYNYYATQVMHHAGGDRWNRWNSQLRDWLVGSQVRTGFEAGSWDVTDPHGNRGGRHYQTCLAIMTLEVYYRHLPLYQMQRPKE
ncbi:MAG: terpene cyclase/mutase family protein [Planctomycetaceae bacterium]|nr:terpene cyclase/mutase family protein [Planctomycetaceae bacterium]